MLASFLDFMCLSLVGSLRHVRRLAGDGNHHPDFFFTVYSFSKEPIEPTGVLQNAGATVDGGNLAPVDG